jgi:radical SAM protein with 4Fe4S-binding SPASM domain
MPEDDDYSRYRKDENGKYIIKSSFPDHCWRMWSAAVITWDGRVVPCCFDKDAKYQLGSMEDKGFKDVWKGEAYTSFRQALFSGRKEIDICLNCTEGLKSGPSIRRS